jgi:anti-anti-sigma factor
MKTPRRHTTLELVESTQDATGAAGPTRARTADVVVAGNLTAATRGTLHVRLRHAVRAGGRDVRVDLRAVERLDAAGVAVLLIFRRMLPPLGGGLVLVGASRAVEETLAEMRLGHLLSA